MTIEKDLKLDQEVIADILVDTPEFENLDAGAYAKLFAAAPELLAALILCERALEERDQEAEAYAAKKARAAIAKAEGK